MKPKKLSYQQNAAYNTAGSLIYGFCLWLTTLVVVRLSDDYTNAGIWQLSISVTNVFFTLAGFSLPGYAVSDTTEEHSSGTYSGTQLLMCLVSQLLCMAYGFACGYRGTIWLSIGAYMLAVNVNAFLAILSSFNQRNYRMDIGAVSQMMIGVGGLVSFAVLLQVTNKVWLAAVGMVAVNVFVLVFYHMPRTKQFADIRPAFSRDTLTLLKQCLPMALSQFGLIAMSTVPRQILQAVYNEEMLGYYATVATPVVVLQTLAMGLFAPILRDLALYYRDGAYRKIQNILKKIGLFLLVMLACGIAGSEILGESLWTLVYGETIRAYCGLLYGIVGCTVLFSACYVFMEILMVMRQRKAMVIVSAAGLFVTAILGRMLIVRYGLNGTSFAVMSGYLVFMALSTAVISKKLRGGKREGD